MKSRKSFPLMLFETEAERLKTRHDSVSPRLSRLLARSQSCATSGLPLPSCMQDILPSNLRKNFSDLALLVMLHDRRAFQNTVSILRMLLFGPFPFLLPSVSASTTSHPASHASCVTGRPLHEQRPRPPLRALAIYEPEARARVSKNLRFLWHFTSRNMVNPSRGFTLLP
jgi:hypothetical protein